MARARKQIQRTRPSTIVTRAVYAVEEEAGMSPELKRFIEECVGECVEKRLSQIIATSPVKKARLYDAWIGLLSFVTLLSAYFTMILILPTVPGILLLASCIITLVLFTFTRL